MKTKRIRWLALLLSLLLLLCACHDGPPVESDPPESGTGTAPVETGAAQGEKFPVLILDGIPRFRVIRPDGSALTDADVSAAQSIRELLQSYAPKEFVELKTDWTMSGTYDADTPEILVGNTAYPETAAVAGEMKYGDYAIRLVGKKIVIWGMDTGALDFAASAFVNLIRKAAQKDAETGKITVAFEPEELNVTGTKVAALSDLPLLDGGSACGAFDAGDGCRELIVKKCTPEIYRAYIDRLKSSGYTEYTSREVSENLFTTLYNEKYTLNVSYVAYNKNIRIITEPFAPETLIGRESENVFTEVTTSQISLIGLEYLDADGVYQDAGLCVLIRLSDGRFVVVDGGFARQDTAKLLLGQLLEQSKDYRGTDGPVIAAWIITHLHSDHCGVMYSFASMFPAKGVRVERVIVNLLSDVELARSKAAYPKNYKETEGTGRNGMVAAIRQLGAVTTVAHVGQVYHLANLDMECLYTCESALPSPTHALNGTSLIFKMTFTDPKTGQKTTYMSTGDATGQDFDIISKMYGSYLKSDIVQVAHHGFSTWGMESSTMEAYRIMSPATLLWPLGHDRYPVGLQNNYNKPLYDPQQNPNYRETFLAGAEGEISILPLPYTPGSGIEIRNP